MNIAFGENASVMTMQALGTRTMHARVPKDSQSIKQCRAIVKTRY
jgi:hypothetical protein